MLLLEFFIYSKFKAGSIWKSKILVVSQTHHIPFKFEFDTDNVA